jgi:hypothetical protein
VVEGKLLMYVRIVSVCGHDNSNDQVDCILGWSISSKLIEISTDVVVILNSYDFYIPGCTEKFSQLVSQC